MKILAIASSFKRDGNSETLLDRALAGINKKNAAIKKIALADLRLHPCTGCFICLKTGECVIKDDMQLVYKELAAADIILAASPIYFMGLPCQLKCVIDRCQVIWGRKNILRKPKTENRKPKRYGAVILVSASSGVENMFTGAIRTLKAWFNTLDAEYKYEFIAEGLEGETDALKDKKLLKKAVEFGEKLGEK
jgi:multimeric flavodoxin WrbA